MALTLVFEFNVHHVPDRPVTDTGGRWRWWRRPPASPVADRGYATLWILPGIRKEDSFDEDFLEHGDYGRIAGAIKFAGPIGFEQAVSIEAALKTLLADLNVEYYHFVTADD